MSMLSIDSSFYSRATTINLAVHRKAEGDDSFDRLALSSSSSSDSNNSDLYSDSDDHPANNNNTNSNTPQPPQANQIQSSADTGLETPREVLYSGNSTDEHTATATHTTATAPTTTIMTGNTLTTNNADSLNQPSFNELSITCDTLTETDDESFGDIDLDSCDDDDDNDDDNDDELTEVYMDREQKQQQGAQTTEFLATLTPHQQHQLNLLQDLYNQSSRRMREGRSPSLPPVDCPNGGGRTQGSGSPRLCDSFRISPLEGSPNTQPLSLSYSSNWSDCHSPQSLHCLACVPTPLSSSIQNDSTLGQSISSSSNNPLLSSSFNSISMCGVNNHAAVDSPLNVSPSTTPRSLNCSNYTILPPSNAKPQGKASMISSILKRGKKRLATKFSNNNQTNNGANNSHSHNNNISGNHNGNNKDYNNINNMSGSGIKYFDNPFDPSPTTSITTSLLEPTPSYVQVYRGITGESWRVKVYPSTTVTDLISMLLSTTTIDPSTLTLYITKSLNDSSLGSSGSLGHHSEMGKPAERQLHNDEKILKAQRKWSSSSVFILKTSSMYNNQDTSMDCRWPSTNLQLINYNRE
ncbi:hypothetical protein SAMD00019534_103840 [Acytostelium subglobosum LB1]|uniref:hypothetical protein n=1 Tax=Acytostelium subglobosum LB1 TaxID=1410327 RepID=UPI00064482A6|nr:hypothetical protein SAMD00019534_103840 [Acytostelium subglobosum LB1]GAM27209.1 hypothetical protein SAMD00019534_103840 [Acytostelium subglobosum LB1]|eukprot:XP_012749676.1 hypothetical protein SAMD00019534_103840 [Acytostelium subglobosum LB1]